MPPAMPPAMAPTLELDAGLAGTGMMGAGGGGGGAGTGAGAVAAAPCVTLVTGSPADNTASGLLDAISVLTADCLPLLDCLPADALHSTFLALAATMSGNLDQSADGRAAAVLHMRARACASLEVQLAPSAARMPASSPEVMAFVRVVLASCPEEDGTSSPTDVCTPCPACTQSSASTCSCTLANHHAGLVTCTHQLVLLAGYQHAAHGLLLQCTTRAARRLGLHCLAGIAANHQWP